MGSLVTCMVVIKWTLAPWQRVFKRVKEVPNHPGHDGVVEKADQERHDHGSNSQKINDKPKFPVPNKDS